MTKLVELRFKVGGEGRFLHVEAEGEVDAAAGVRMAREISVFGGDNVHLPVLLDARGLRGYLTTLDTVELVKTLAAERERYRRKLAVLARDDAQIDRARFLELYSNNRGIPIAAFTDYDAALQWLAEP